MHRTGADHPLYLAKYKKAVLSFCLLFILNFGCRQKERSWSIYKADASSTSYSPYSDINTNNLGKLRLAWTFNPDDATEGARFGASESNPIVIDGIMYTASARHRIYAIDAGTGRQRWSFDPFHDGRGGGVCRGVTYWEDGADKRILFTGGDQLFALNAETGKLILQFGDSGRVSMNIGMRDDPKLISVKPTSPGIIFRDLLIIGNEVSELYGAQPGYIRAYNVRTGKLVWTFHTVPKPGEPGYETWPKDAWKYAGGANDWGGLSLDEKRGMVFLATGSPSYDFYGADRAGQNLFGNCVIALDALTGKYIWHFQTIHHDLWDYDLPAPPNLVTILRDGKKIDAIAQTSKIGFLYVLNRETGEPMFPVEERPVPASDVPGEQTWPTQPFPQRPKPYSRQRITEDDLSDFSPASHDSLLKTFRTLRYEGLFTPPSLKGSLNFPGTIGGSEWGGAAYDPATGILYLKSNESPEINVLKKLDTTGIATHLSGFDLGRQTYRIYCAGCHKMDRYGDEPLYPSLVDLKKRMSETDAIQKIRDGGGKMPAFGGILNGKEKALTDFLFDRQGQSLSIRKGDVSEIEANSLSNTLSAQEKSKADTAARYLNVSAYGIWRDPDGNPAIRPPWAVLNAINLNTGEYEWQVPVGNIPELRKPGEPETGSTGSPGPMVTAGGLVWIAGSRDRSLRAFSKTNGKLLWTFILPGIGSSIPCSYKYRGKQYIAISVAGNKDTPAGSILAFALSD
ncbi:MAG: PQQ-binding-like beta-propeller repeat protein [Bacteroidota bacterium]|nr:PQQ-binding-like beta-propeller repeat protein [Bacteroidota bacterium]